MKPGKTFLSAVLILFYLLVPGKGMAIVSHGFYDRGLSLIECPCCAETGKNSAGTSLPGGGDDLDIFEHGCDCSCHLPSRPNPPAHPDDAVLFMPDDAPLSYPEVYIPIFVPPQNLA